MWRGGVSQRDRQDALGETHLPHHVECRRLQHVASKITIEIRVSLEQRDRDALSGQQQAQDGAGRPTADDAAIRVLDAPGLVDIDRLDRLIGMVAHLVPRKPLSGIQSL
jgi:hypothetical protein